MKTVKNMWSISKGLTIFTLAVVAALLIVLGIVWWIPVYFGYPWYCIVGNLVVTAMGVGCWMLLSELVND